MTHTITFSPQEIELLQQQVFNDNTPGTLLKDFTMILDFIGSQGLEVSKINHLISSKYLPEINALLTHPLTVDLKRPVQKSYPPINGLYLLLRASGLAYVETNKSRSRLMLNPKIMDSWKGLNAIERYFALFDAWWQRGSQEIIGEEKDLDASSNYFYPSIKFLHSKFQKQPYLNLIKTEVQYLRYHPGFHSLALLELFGFITVELDANPSDAVWPIRTLALTPWGSVLLPGLAGSMTNLTPYERYFDTATLTQLFDTLKSIRPDLRNTLLFAEQDFPVNAALTFKVNLEDASRTLLINSSDSLDDLAHAILAAFAFDNDHLYEFVYKNRFSITKRISHPEALMDEDEASTATCLIWSLGLVVGSKLTFLFDFGDNWKFSMELEAIDTETTPPAQPKVIKRSGKPPTQYWDDEFD